MPPRLPEFVAVDRWRSIRLALFVAYGLAYAFVFLRVGIIIDRVSVAVWLALLLGIGHLGRPWSRWRRLATDLLLYTAMWLAYDETRGAADRLGMPLQVESVRNIDRALFLGADPVVWLQRRFYSPEVVRWWDVAASVVYATHFIVPVAVIAVLWLSHRTQWVRFMRRFASVLLVGCASFVLLPTAPPWMAAGGDPQIRLDAIDPVVRSTARGWNHLGLESFDQFWDTGRDWANRIAAMPSLHAAAALFVVVFFFPWIRHWWLRATTLLFPVAMGLSLVYLGEHYVADVLAGWILVGGAFMAWARIERRTTSRRHDQQHVATNDERFAKRPRAPVAG